MLRAFPDIRAAARRGGARARWTTNRQRRRRPSTVAARRLPEPGADGGAEPAGPRPGEVHALRRVRAGLRRRARRRHAPGPRGAALRQVPGGHLLPLVPRSALHGRLPGRLDPPPRTRSRSSSRTGASAAACAPSNCPYGNINLHPFKVERRRTRTRPGERKAVVQAEGDHLRPVPASTHEPSCVYACPHDAAQRVEPAKFFADPEVDARSPAMLIDRTHRGWIVGCPHRVARRHRDLHPLRAGQPPRADGRQRARTDLRHPRASPS